MVLTGVLVIFVGKFSWAGKLPGDINWRSGSYSGSIPIVSSVLASILLTVILNIVLRR
ncbi:MAG: DUF2905 domain-containing protein [Chloroflexota bacterium]